MPNNGYENFGVEITVDGANSAVSNLNRFEKRYEKLAGTEIRVAKAQIALKNAHISLQQSEQSLANATKVSENAQKQKEIAVNNVAKAHERLLAIEKNEKATELQRTVAAMNYSNALLQQGIAENNLTIANTNLNKARETQEKRVNAVTTAELSLQQAMEAVEKQQNRSTKSLASYATKLTSSVVIARKLGRFVASAIQESANYVENLNLFAVAYGDVYQETLKWALDLADGFGLASNEVLKFAGTFRQLSTSLGLVEDTANSVSKTVTQLGYDMSALFNTTVENAMEKLQSGLFSGNVRPLRAYGIDISQNQIDALFETNQALASLGVNARNLSQSDKVLARLIITLRDGSNAFGTMNREINTLQSQIRILQGSFSNFKLAIGDLVYEPVRKVLLVFNAFLISITNIIRLFKPLQTTDETVFNGVAMGAEEANKQIDELNGKLADFDKFNVLGGQSNTTTNDTVTKALTAELEKQQEKYAAVSKETQNQATALAEYLTPALSGALIVMVAFSSKISLLGKVLSNLKSPTAIVIGAFVALYSTSDYFKEAVNNLLVVLLKLVGDTLSPLVKTLQTLMPIVEKLLNVAGYVLGFFVNVLAKIVEFLDKTGLLEGAIWTIIIALIALKAVQIGKWAIDVYRHFSLFAGIFDAMVKASGGLLAAIKNLGASFGQFLATQAKNFLSWLNTSKGSMGALVLGVGVLVGGIMSFVSSFDQLSSKAKVWIPIIASLAGVVTALVAGLTVMKGNWAGAIGLGALVAGIGLSVGTKLSTSAHEDGGYTNANLIMTHENGKREWVGKAAGSSAIVNDTQMSDIMEVAVSKGVYNALSARSAMGGNVPTNETIVVKIGEEAVFTAVRKTARRQGRDFATV